MHRQMNIYPDEVEEQPLFGSAIYTSEKLPIEPPSNPSINHFPMPCWTWARTDLVAGRKRKRPQTIAHRGFKAEHPENTMNAFKGAVHVGSDAIETDIHLTKDDVVVLSHDADLKRCFGRPEKIIDCDWDDLNMLRTTKSPHEPLPRLRDLLEYVSSPSQDHIWLLLDIKLDNDPDDVIRLISETLKSVNSPRRPWSDRIVLGIWAAKYLPLCSKYLPGFPISHIGFSTCYARQFLNVPNVSFNMLQKVLLGPIGNRFIRDVQKAHRPLFVWTVNETNIMKWSIQKQVDGVITDNPKKFRQICKEWDDEDEPLARVSAVQWLSTLMLYFMIMVYIIPFRRKYPETVENLLRKKDRLHKTRINMGA